MSSIVEKLCYRWDILLIQVYCKDHGNWGPDNHGLTVVSYDKKKEKKREKWIDFLVTQNPDFMIVPGPDSHH